MNKHFDPGSVIVILVTFALFTVALFVKGLTQDMLLEAGVLLVSIKLIMMAYKSSTANKEIKKELQVIKQMIAEGSGPEDRSQKSEATGL